MRFEIHESAPSVRIPKRMPDNRTDGLWQTTCCELFIKPAHEDAYFEINLSPSTEWAVYMFDGYRDGMRPVDLGRDPQIEVTSGEQGFTLDSVIDLSLIAPSRLAGGFALALSAVIEETDGTKSYWALAHPHGKPDFHHPTCFALTLPAPQVP